jgi:hypothetical protein
LRRYALAVDALVTHSVTRQLGSATGGSRTDGRSG